jgi:hypothetical protein
VSCHVSMRDLFGGYYWYTAPCNSVCAQIGSIDVLDDADPASASYNSTAGSGGGFPGAGYGGGRIVLKVGVPYSACSASGLTSRAM